MSINKEKQQKQIELFHDFSKSPVHDTQDISNAVNKAGHTITTNDIWAEEIPYINADFRSTNEVPQAINANSVRNDILLIGPDTATFNEKTAYKRNDTPFTTGASFTSLWTQVGTFSDCLETDEVSGQKVCLQNKSGKNVIRYYENKTLELLTAENNSQASGNNQSARLRSIADSSQFVEQFVSITDKMCGGYPAKGYSASVTITSSGNPQVEGVNYWLLAYSGMVLYQDNEGVNRNITCFEYIGKKLDKCLGGGAGGGVVLEGLEIKQGKILDNDIVEALTAIDPDLAQMNHTIVKVSIADETDDQGEEITGQLDNNGDYVLWDPTEVPSSASMPSTVNVALSLSSAE